MNDLHCHILPNVDDWSTINRRQHCNGKGSMRRRNSYNRCYSSSPKWGLYESAKSILHQVKQLNERLKEEDINLTILPGQEIRLYGELLEDYDSRRIVTLNVRINRY